MKQLIILTFVLAAGILLVNLNNEPDPSSQEASIPASASTPTATGTGLVIEEIEAYAKKHDIPPVDAKMDRVWKAIPGYNGLTVDIEKSYQNMLDRDQFNADQVVFQEVSPQIRLKDLPPSPIYRGNPQKPMAALLINVAWGEEHIPGMLKTLKESNVKASFFFDGSWAKKNPDILTQISLEGHEVGNHAYSHPNLETMTREETLDELQKTNDVIESVLGVKPKWFAPPSGSFNQTTIDTAHELDMKTILWTVDTVDWKKPDPSEMVSRVLSKVEKGSLILMHPTQPTAEGLASMIDGIQKKELQIGTVSEVLSENRTKPSR